MENESITIDKKIIRELMESIEDIQLKLESIELSSNKEFMTSLKKSKEEIKNRDFADWNEIQNISNETI